MPGPLAASLWTPCKDERQKTTQATPAEIESFRHLVVTDMWHYNVPVNCADNPHERPREKLSRKAVPTCARWRWFTVAQNMIFLVTTIPGGGFSMILLYRENESLDQIQGNVLAGQAGLMPHSVTWGPWSLRLCSWGPRIRDVAATFVEGHCRRR